MRISASKQDHNRSFHSIMHLGHYCIGQSNAMPQQLAGQYALLCAAEIRMISAVQGWSSVSSGVITLNWMSCVLFCKSYNKPMSIFLWELAAGTAAGGQGTSGEALAAAQRALLTEKQLRALRELELFGWDGCSHPQPHVCCAFCMRPLSVSKAFAESVSLTLAVQCFAS